MISFFKKKKKQQDQSNSTPEQQPILNPALNDNIKKIQDKTGNSSDIQIRKINIGENKKNQLAFIFIQGIVDRKLINEFIVESLMQRGAAFNGSPQQLYDFLKEEVVALGSIQTVKYEEKLFQTLMAGNTIILIDGLEQALVASTQGGEQRAIEEPQSQVTVRGPRDGFTESLDTNLSLIRRRIQNPDLWVETMRIGRLTNTEVAIMYLNGTADAGIVDEVRRRLKKIDIESILESGYIEQLIEDQSFTTFPTLYHTERPDTVAGNIIEGRVAIFVDGTPFVLLAPSVFFQFFQSVEDYYARFDIATFLRFLRILTFFISLIVPSIYISLTTYHQEMIPTALLVVIAAQRENVPFPAFVEALIMELTFEILREAGVRMPRAVGSAISIVGALVIGQAAVQAGIVSPAMVIVVAITAIASFSTPSFAIAISARLIRFLFMVSAALFGAYGIILGLIFLVVHLCGLRSFGVPYTTPLAPVTVGNLGDTFIRVPLWVNRLRANLIKKNNLHGEEERRPQPPKDRGMTTGKVRDERDEE